jgi:hypothetical protein
MECQERPFLSTDVKKQDNGQKTPPENIVVPENKKIDEEGKLEPDTEKGHNDEVGPEKKTEPAPELPSAYRRFFIFVAVCLSIFLVRHPTSIYYKLGNSADIIHRRL